ncbi:large subunit ribosomal protein L25 [Bhargavaea ginsengi]|uniref:Large ribosomal subunit protein bL25 n=1 Tax=Bhargavaea ginsengi TaxID=426757 RepID=A0A1H7C5L6_9BACL|nr:50S ribosomal protein L25/general stress protein Ctc [Bhargavaea ginsengi]MCM3088931.1 50S ribosomal protein L25/general stress protein Ctc [Bhargavaea ginsengi]SEJ85069.1 large subunit ribosomal protein L25 [Bhargavaea ginsengi]
MAMTIKAEKREKSGRSGLTGLRTEGYVPAVVYGYKLESVPVAIREKDLMMTLRDEGRNAVFQLEVDGKKVNAVLHDYQTDVMKGEFKHADFLAIDMNTEMEAEVNVSLIGDDVAPGIKEGGVLSQPFWTVNISAKPSDMPESLEVDVSEMAVGDTLTVGDIKSKWGVDVTDEDDKVLATITAPRVEQAEDDAEEGAADPEAGADAEAGGGADEAPKETE